MPSSRIVPLSGLLLDKGVIDVFRVKLKYAACVSFATPDF
jgi:hypothetical protein